MSLRLSYILALLFLAAPLLAAPALTPMVELTVDSEQAQYDHQEEVITTHGPTTLRAEISGQPQERLLIKAPATRTDLRAQTVEASQGVQFIVPQAFLSGEALTLQTAPRAFTLDQAQAVINLAPPDGPIVLGQLRGRRISGHGEVLVLEDGMISPCATERSEVAFRARRAEYDPATHRLRLRGSSLDFYGVRVPLLPYWTERLGGRRESTRGLLPTLGYSKRDGVYIPYYFDFAGAQPDRVSDLNLRATAKRGITFLSENRRVQGRWVAEGWASRMEDVRDKLRAYLVYDRLPELLLTGYQHGADQNQGWKLGTSLGNFYERDQTQPALPEVHRLRALAGLGYHWGGHAQTLRQGRWASVWSTGAVYSRGEHFLDTTMTLGVGRRFSPSFQGDLQYLHHFQGGQSPFQFDRVDLPRELRPALDWQVTRSWRLVSFGRYDTQHGALRDYRLELSKRFRCLTWGVYYNFVGAGLGLRVDLNGLTGGTAPPPLTGPLAEQYLRSQQELEAP
jgi:hypothetical protein